MDHLRLLFVDDEEELVSTVVERLELRGVDAVGVTSGDEALRRLQDEAFQVVVIDVKMPGIGGLEVLRTINRRNPEIKVVLMRACRPPSRSGGLFTEAGRPRRPLGDRRAGDGFE